MKTYMTLVRAILVATLAATASAKALESPENSSFALTTRRYMPEVKLDRLGDLGIADLEVACMAQGANDTVTHGIPGITLRFRNNAANERSFRVEAQMPGSANVQKEFSIPPGGTTEFTLFMPLAEEKGSNFYSNGVRLRETTPKSRSPNSQRWDIPININMPNGFHPANDAIPSALLSKSIDAKKLEDWLTKAQQFSNYKQRHKHSSYGSRKASEPAYNLAAHQYEFPTADWPRDWRCYSTFDAVFITAGDYGTLNEDAKSALEVYRAFGGAVFVTAGPDGFADLSEATKVLPAIDDSFEALVGDLGISRYYYSYSSSSNNLEKDLKRIPIKAKSTVPVKTLQLVLAIFALVIVPLVTFRSVRRNMRMKLLVFLPGSAALFAILIAIFAYVFFGTTPSVRLQSVTILDQTARKALTRGQFAVFSPVSIDGGISFPLDAAFRMRNVGGQQTCSMGVADALRLNSGWTKPLVTSFFDFERACERSERLDFRTSPSGEVTVANLLGAKVVWGQANVDGKLYEFTDIPPGGEAKAKKLDATPKTEPRESYCPFKAAFNAATGFGRDWDGTLSHAKSCTTMIPSGEYLAEIEGSPFFPNPVTRKKTNTSAAGLVYGKFKEAAE